MDVRLSDEQRLLAETMDDLATASAQKWEVGHGPDSVQSSAPDPAVWAGIVRAELLSMRLAEAEGGAGAGCLDVCIAVEAFARRTVAAPLLGTLILVEQLRRRNADPAGLAELAAGASRWSCALTPDLSRFARSPLGATGWDCGGAEAAVVIGERDATLHPLGPDTSIDPTRAIAPVANGRPGTAAIALGPPDADAETAVLAFSLTAIAADLLGVMQAALEESVRHASTRRQFGAAIGSFQAVAHLLAEALVSVESSRSAIWYAAWACDALPPGQALTAARVAKAFAARCAVEVAETAIQVHGGLGMTWEASPHLWLRRAHTGRWALGDENHQYDRLTAADDNAPATGGQG